MVKRFLSANTSEILAMSGAELKQSIKASEGRIIVSENVVMAAPVIGDITNAEMARAFGADLLLLNGLDVLNPVINGLGDYEGNFVDRLHHLVGRPIGVNLEPVDPNIEMMSELIEIPKGRQANSETLAEIEKLGMDFVCFTGNPGTGVTNQAIIDTVKQARQSYSGLIIAGKMHAAGVDEPVLDLDVVQALIDAGADVILAPSVGSVPGFQAQELTEAVKIAHRHGALVMSAIGTSQESAEPETIRYMAIQNKMCGVDMQHIGDAGYGGLAPVDNILVMSRAIRGQRHTLSMIARSINR
ncbi:hypothetical protein [Eremococcus coleocola]|uniref:DUF7916 domain-containing protein n=1 Tax=Eremococcus coleocola ACS-139-V-Col8 TaxID=908337 RepID=E4KQU4_9LACT|nr:hypothetical protein [Eremococcus coleocola]EFR30561.1 hypothetical protein HMPREF9257_0654 [Eremococcus coleocola ACS-139-V-Col8]